jgi:REP element-mobilizing transposase RayT
MPYNPAMHHRRSIRLSGYDYTQSGMYFVTICAYQKECLFGEIIDGEMQLNQYGQIVAQTYQWLSQRYPYICLDEWIIMPNHFHGIMVITDNPCRGVASHPSGSANRPYNNRPHLIQSWIKTQTIGTFNWCIQNRFHQKTQYPA